ncbi:Hypothetical predicted protein [Pelobates cultripes]|nr:Hypothetical predicted protein [Pelobates cultripes]
MPLPTNPTRVPEAITTAWGRRTISCTCCPSVEPDNHRKQPPTHQAAYPSRLKTPRGTASLQQPCKREITRHDRSHPRPATNLRQGTDLIHMNTRDTGLAILTLLQTWSWKRAMKRHTAVDNRWDSPTLVSPLPLLGIG